MTNSNGSQRRDGFIPDALLETIAKTYAGKEAKDRYLAFGIVASIISFCLLCLTLITFHVSKGAAQELFNTLLIVSVLPFTARGMQLTGYPDNIKPKRIAMGLVVGFFGPALVRLIGVAALGICY